MQCCHDSFLCFAWPPLLLFAIQGDHQKCHNAMLHFWFNSVQFASSTVCQSMQRKTMLSSQFDLICILLCWYGRFWFDSIQSVSFTVWQKWQSNQEHNEVLPLPFISIGKEGNARKRKWNSYLQQLPLEAIVFLGGKAACRTMTKIDDS